MSDHAIDAEGTALAAQLRNAVIATSIECRRCGYDVQGLAADGRCPECGLPLAETIGFLVDPEASRLPRLSAPRVVGASLFRVTALLAGSLLLLLGEGTWRFHRFPRARLPLVDALELPRHLPWLAAALGLLALWPALRLRPPRQGVAGAVGRDVRTLVLGLCGWAVSAAAMPWVRVLAWGDVPAGTLVARLVLVVSGATMLLGLGGILATIGDRSRAYRRSRAGRQSVQAMLAAVLGIAAGLLARAVAVALDLERLRTLATVVVWVCCLMAAIGQLYLVLNAWWIRTDLRRRSLTLDQLLLPRLPDDALVPGNGESEPG